MFITSPAALKSKSGANPQTDGFYPRPTAHPAKFTETTK
jgi:hypothetical protein